MVHKILMEIEQISGSNSESSAGINSGLRKLEQTRLGMVLIWRQGIRESLSSTGAKDKT